MSRAKLQPKFYDTETLFTLIRFLRFSNIEFELEMRSFGVGVGGISNMHACRSEVFSRYFLFWMTI